MRKYPWSISTDFLLRQSELTTISAPKSLAQCSQPLDGISVPVMTDRSEVVLVEAEIRRIVELVGQTPAQLLQIMPETLLARRTLKYAVDVQEDHRTAGCFVLHFL